MSLAEGRAPRRTAGNRLSGLLQAEEEDEFYQTTYGGFNEESGDDEYRGEHSDTEDEVDSDFDLDEGDEPGSEEQDEAEPRRRRRVLTKAYREPLKSLRPKKPEGPRGGSQKSREVKSVPLELQDDVGDSRKHMRQSTTEHTRQTFLRLQERQVQSKRKKGGTSYERPLTQEELLEEAKITEEINLRSLENYERLEADKKKQVQKKRQCVGPVIRYCSLTMPLLPEPPLLPETPRQPLDVEGLDQDPPQADPSPVGKCSRTFISFSDDETFERFFPRSKAPRLPVRELCPVTHRPALYRDPVTDIPYSNIRAFRIIREAYKKYITAHGLPGASLGGGGGGGGAAPRPGRQKIVIKESVPTA
ncbi:vacuolar protein sorting-associated protein 72 homolog isoform X1 [Myiozetetes cayanensis]|uniref:vacuolar protein sorting-associated protein 72 homolog isoform X1 n=1 Tax=Myiozetetes cayanensis TaxID=478635 RepID=UPI002160E54A|nr:vacuolar protein sorting-associated protein 72 homolog isoform X1 [Myiozetetes cayanensis]